MKRIPAVLLVASVSLSLFSQEDKIKSGWNIGVLPAISFNTELGFQYGGLINLYHYGDGSNYPAYNHSLYLEISRYTKGSSIYRFMYDSDVLIPGISLTTDISFLTDEAFDFYGFNGYESVYNQSFSEDSTRMFYKHKRTLFRFKNDLKGRLAGDHFFWNAGLTIKSFNVRSVDIDKLNKGKDEDLLPPVDGLYDKYVNWGIIDQDEADGGLIATVKAGVSYDSRDFKANAMKGIWFETGVEVSPSFISENGFARFYAVHRQYFTLIPRNLSFAYRLGYQTTFAGEVPFYFQNQIITSVLTGTVSEGLGGEKTIRGILRNRIVGDGLLYGNLELRWKAIRFSFINQNFYTGLVGFSDVGMVTKNHEFDIPDDAALAGESATDYFNPGQENIHLSAGAGLRIVMNENFIIAVDWGKAFNEQDGDSGFYIGLNYLF
ncbi:MAG TPA: hypothetical protein VMW76_09820 [Bacteroidales bacterium]|nr:hypothetical protein [Bacteroidales bacterium]